MRWAQKKLVQLQAWQLGTNTPMERKMIEEGRIIQQDDGQYELFSLEATGGSGEIAKAGDYFKVDAAGCPYLNEKTKFESMHRAIGDGWYE